MNGFLDTEGILYECSSWEHLDKAEEIVESMGISISNRLEAENYLQKLGWVVVRTRDVYGMIGCYKEGSRERYHLTDAQINWLNNAYEDMTLECRKSVDEMFEWNK